MATKLCYGCNQHLEANADNFHKHPKTKDGLTTRCKSCTNTTNRGKYNQNKLERTMAKTSVEGIKQYVENIEDKLKEMAADNLWD